MNRLLNLQDGLNDDLIAHLYQVGRRELPARGNRPALAAWSGTDTIGVAERQTQYTQYIYRRGYYDDLEAPKTFQGRVGELLHMLSDVAHGVLVEVPAPAENDHSVEARIDKANRRKAQKMLDYIEKSHNQSSRGGVFRRVCQRNGVPPDSLDNCETIMGLPNGALLLKWEEHSVVHDAAFHPEALNTMVLGVPYVPGSTCPDWEAFIKEALSYNPLGRRTGPEEEAKILAEIRLLRASAGYWMVRGNREDAVTKFHGPSGSGKSTIMRVLCEIFGSYAVNGRKAMIIKNFNGKINADVGMYVKKHLVYIDEFNAEDVLDTGLLRYLTNPKITVEKKYANPFEATNNMKLLLVTNYDNKFDAPDKTMMRRMINFEFHRPEIRPEDSDPLLWKKMFDKEGPGILLWCIAGLIDVMTYGLRNLIPEHMREAVEQELLMQDRLASFLYNYLIKPVKNETPVLLAPVKLKDSYLDMIRYFDALEEEPPVKNIRNYGGALRNHGYEVRISHGTTCIYGVIRRPFTGLEIIDKKTEEGINRDGKMLTRDIIDYVHDYTKGCDEGRGVPITSIRDALHESHGYDQNAILERLRVLESIHEVTIENDNVKLG